MSIVSVIKRSFLLLPKNDRRKYVITLVFQIFTAVLDLIGVAAVGAIVYVSSNVGPSKIAASRSSRFFDRLLNNLPANSKVTFYLGLTVIVFFVLKSVLSLLLLKSIYGFLVRCAVDISINWTRRFFSASLPLIQKKSSQEILYGLSGGITAAIPDTLGAGAIVISELAMASFLVIGLSSLNFILALVTFFYFAFVSYLLHFKLGSIAHESGTISSKSDVRTNSLIQQGIFGFREIFSSNRGGELIKRYSEVRLEAGTAYVNSQWINLVPKFALEGALVIGCGLLASFLAFVDNSAGGFAIMATFLVAGTRIIPSILRIQNSIFKIKNAQGYSSYAFDFIRDIKQAELLNLTKGDFSTEDQLLRGEFDPTVSVKNVSFTYPGNSVAALSGINMSVSAGEKVAIVGGTGAGKSTLVDLILGLISPTYGSVHINEVSPELAISRWEGQFGYVPQHTFLFDGTILQNVALLIPDDLITQERVWEVLEIVNLDLFVEQLPNGLETPVGENGIKLSGGQRQRLGLARALYSNPKLIVLDEATSSLDVSTENFISESLSKLSHNVTTITIAHRLTTVRNSDRIYYLSQGELIAAGNFDWLCQNVPEFEKQANLSGLR